jgi:hypothetical protein
VKRPCDERHYYVVTAYDTWQPANESGPSNVVQVPDTTAPSAPDAFTLLELLLQQALDTLRKTPR